MMTLRMTKAGSNTVSMSWSAVNQVAKRSLTNFTTGAFPFDPATMGDRIPFPYSDHTQGNVVIEVV